MLESNNPIRLWCFFYKCIADIIFLCETVLFKSLFRTPYETVMNYTPDIYEYAAFSWLQRSWLFDENLKRKQVCRWL